MPKRRDHLRFEESYSPLRRSHKNSKYNYDAGLSRFPAKITLVEARSFSIQKTRNRRLGLSYNLTVSNVTSFRRRFIRTNCCLSPFHFNNAELWNLIYTELLQDSVVTMHSSILKKSTRFKLFAVQIKCVSYLYTSHLTGRRLTCK